MYYAKPGPGDRKIYFYAGSNGKKKMVSIKNIPEAVRIALEAGTAEVDETILMADTLPQEEQPVANKSCLFCGAYSNLTRLVNGQTVVICIDDYHTMTLGQIAAKLRGKDEGPKQTEEAVEEKEEVAV